MITADESHLNERFQMKAVIVIVGVPGEIANALVDERSRRQWDMDLKSIHVVHSSDTLNIQYKGAYSEDLTYTFAESFLQGATTYLIHERVN